MKIAFVNQPWAMVLPPAQSGSLSIWTWEVARRLACKHDVTVYEGCKRWSLPDVDRCEGVRYRFFRVAADQFVLRVLDRVKIPKTITSQHAARRYFYLSYAVQVALDLRREQTEVVHIHQCSQFASIIRALNPRIRIVLHMNCEWLTQFDAQLVEPRLTDPDVILGCSDHITNLIRRRFPQIANRCHTVPNGVDSAKFVPAAIQMRRGASDRKRLAFVGRVSPEKGVHTLVEAFSIVARRRPDVELEIVGPVCSLPPEWIVELSSDPLVTDLKQFYVGEYETHLRERIGEAAEGRVQIAGKILNDNLVDFYHSIDILINPSLSESFGMTVVEAMACGKPVIVTEVGGMTETVLQGKNGLRVPPANEKALAEAILYLLENDELRALMGHVGRQRASELYGWDTVAAKWLECCSDHSAARLCRQPVH